MIIAEHLCGVAVAYNPERSDKPKIRVNPTPGREQGSLINYQRRAVANAVEYIRQTATARAMIFTVTTSHRWPGRARGKLLSMLIENMKKNYGLREYVWVREVGHKKPPHYQLNIHYHFVADVDWFDAPKLSLYWAGLFGYHCAARMVPGDDGKARRVLSKNSIRLGSKPDKLGKVRYYIDSPAAAFYLSKYIGKGFEVGGGKSMAYKTGLIMAGDSSTVKRPRNFDGSQRTKVLSLPEAFEGRLYFNQPGGEVLTANGELIPHPAICVGQTFENEQGKTFNKSLYKWKKCKEHSVYIGKLIR